MRSVLNDPSKVGGLEMAVNEQSVGGIVVAEIPNWDKEAKLLNQLGWYSFFHFFLGCNQLGSTRRPISDPD